MNRDPLRPVRTPMTLSVGGLDILIVNTLDIHKIARTFS